MKISDSVLMTVIVITLIVCVTICIKSCDLLSGDNYRSNISKIESLHISEEDKAKIMSSLTEEYMSRKNGK